MINKDISLVSDIPKSKKYFVFYECERFEWSNGISTGYHVTKNQVIIDKHPIQFQLDCNEKYGNVPIENIGYTHREDYKVINWIELTEEEYKKFEGRVG